MNITLRSESHGDASAIEAVTTSAFLNPPHSSHTEQFIVNALRRAGRLTISLVAEHEGTIVGHVAVSPVSISDGASSWFGLGPISVLPELQGRGIGSQLMREALLSLRQKKAAGCVLLGNPGYYSLFGFRSVPGLILPGFPPEYFQAISFGAPFPQGEVAYHEAVDARE